MVYPGTSPIAAGRGTPVMRLLCLWLVVFLAAIFSARAAIRFDVFAGYGVEHIVPQATWFPITCEIMNDGAAFVGTIEITGPVKRRINNTLRGLDHLPIALTPA